ncbi:hypothetical protein K7H20_13935 [Salipiger manganoxidans]|uniref:hypothetical protein n=1 Tax=Salipiger marinus TaxID=555512 RepID=UPI001E51A85F|nr:hypothetical protein [Salipiger manganoxidans]MCD1619166.1 hypothetical protein [Salipiger manganoxidans]
MDPRPLSRLDRIADRASACLLIATLAAIAVLLTGVALAPTESLMLLARIWP